MLRRSFACLFQSAPDPTPHVTRLIGESKKRSQARTLDPKQVEKNQQTIASFLEAREAFAAGHGVEIPPDKLDALFDAVERVVPKSDTFCEAVPTPETIFGC